MLGRSCNVSKRAHLILKRSFAQVVPVSTKNTSTSSSIPVTSKPASSTLQHGRVFVREDHGLWHFFRKKDSADLVGEARYETVEHPSKVEQSRTGRAWKASELRLKSFEDLHTLWYIVLRERNLLATQKEEARRMGISDTGLQVSAERVHQCRKTMARIKAVLNERRLAYEGATKLIEEQKQQAEDEVVLQYQHEKLEEDRAQTLSRRELTKRRREARLRTEAEATNAALQEPSEEMQHHSDTKESSSNDSAAQTFHSTEELPNTIETVDGGGKRA
ncbi:Mitochondrial 39-S ribosomal protein L47 (MRP-L47) domain containing protein [Amanita muscaria]